MTGKRRARIKRLAILTIIWASAFVSAQAASFIVCYFILGIKYW